MKHKLGSVSGWIKTSTEPHQCVHQHLRHPLLQTIKAA